MKTKFFALSLLIFLSLPTFQSAAFAQTSKAETYGAKLLVKKGAEIESKSILVTPENDFLKISGKKDHSLDKSFAYASIKTADYAYSDKPQIKEALMLGVLNTFGGLSMLFNKVKKHWLVLETAAETVYLELQQDSYRRLLFDLNANGIKLSDSGDRDKKEEPRQKPQNTSATESETAAKPTN